MKSENAIERDAAVIDVGSNSVRMVHFRLEGRAMWPVFNEKVEAGLGEGAAARGLLNPDGRKEALRALVRFKRLLDLKGVHERYAVATAAVREAGDGPDFVREVFEKTGFELDVLSGEGEGRFSSLGLIAGIPGAHGVVGDLGGSSLELARLENGAPGQAITLALGPQAMAGLDSRKALKSAIDAALAPASLRARKGGAFYAVGGAWRALAFFSMAARDYPLHMVHQYALQRSEAVRLLRLAERQSEASLAGVRGVSTRRAANLPYAALLMRRILKQGGFDRIIFSAYGLREGVISDRAGLDLEADPLIAGADALARPGSPSPSFGRVLAKWIEPALAGDDAAFSARRDRILRETAARLADLGARLHPDHRADLVRENVLYAPFAGISHPERVYLAAALHFRYGGGRAKLDGLDPFTLISPGQRASALALGAALRLGASIAGRSEGLLTQFRLGVEEDSVVLEAEPGAADLLPSRADSLLDGLARATGRNGVIRAR